MTKTMNLRAARSNLLRKAITQASPITTFTAEMLPQWPGGIIYGKIEYRSATQREALTMLREQRAGRDWRFAL